jgi:hypothetical protein
MLNFEEDFTPATPTPTPTPPRAFVAVEAALADEPPAPERKRVRVEDKRIINATADVNQLAPTTGCRRKST